MSSLIEVHLGIQGPNEAKESRTDWFRILFPALICAYLLLVLGLLWWGHGYYLTPLSDRPRHPQHNWLKPSGAIGHSLGVTGTAMMMLSFLYSIRKRWKYLQRFGTQKHWLQFHIFLGLGGPALIAVHSAGKLGGIASIAFYSTMAMVVSGMIGRYLYSKIPRTRRGNEMSLRQIEEQMESWISEIHQGDLKDEILTAVEEYLSRVRKRSRGLIGTISSTILDDLALPWHFWTVWKIARMQPSSFRQRLRTSRFILKQRRLLKSLAILEAMQQLFSFWHIFHKPFTVLASVLLFVHVAVAVYFGYGVSW